LRTFNAGGDCGGATVCDADGATRRCDGVDCYGRGSGEDAATYCVTDGGVSDGGAVHCDGVWGEIELCSHASTTGGSPT
jgi:hypothetical protein